jgi:hypothetical protein
MQGVQIMSNETSNTSRRKPVLAWGGFCDGKLHTVTVDTIVPNDPLPRAFGPALFYTKRTARERYQDVRRIEIREVPRAKR